MNFIERSVILARPRGSELRKGLGYVQGHIKLIISSMVCFSIIHYGETRLCMLDNSPVDKYTVCLAASNLAS